LKNVALCAALLVAAVPGAEQDGIDWERGAIKAMGKGAPDLNAPSIAVARASAERTALLAAQRRALRILERMTLDDGSSAGALLQGDTALRTRVELNLHAVRAARTHYFTDGGVWLEIEVPFAALPPRIAEHLRAAPDGGVTGGDAGTGQDAGTAQDAGASDAGSQPDAGRGPQ